MQIRKFEFPDQATAFALLGEPGLQYLTGAPEVPVVPNQVHLGHIEVTPAVIEDDVVVTEAVLSEKWHVDVLFAGDVPEVLEQYAVWPAVGMHSFAGLETLYEQLYNQRQNL